MRSKSLTYIILIGLILLLSTCTKEKVDVASEPYPLPPADSYRIKEKRIITAYKEEKQTFHYENSKISLIEIHELNNYNSWVFKIKKEFQYPDSVTSIVTIYELDDKGWRPISKMEYKHNNDKLIQYVQYKYEENEFNIIVEYNFIYNQNYLVEQEFTFPSPPPDSYKYVYNWIDDFLVTKLNYRLENNQWINTSLDSLFYSNGSLNEIYRYSLTSASNDQKYKFEFDDQKALINKRWLFKVDGVWNIFTTEIFEYDIYHNLIEYLYNYNPKERYVYEVGKGNNNMFIPPGVIWEFWAPFRQ